MAEKLQNSQYIDHYTLVDGCGNGMVVLVVCTVATGPACLALA